MADRISRNCYDSSTVKFRLKPVFGLEKMTMEISGSVVTFEPSNRKVRGLEMSPRH